MKCLSLILLIIIISLIGCSPRYKSSDNQSEPVDFTDYQKLKSSSTYKDIVKIMGKPDGEISGIDRPIPNHWMMYKNCACAIFLVHSKRTQTGYNLQKAVYIGTIGMKPPRTLHVADEKYRQILDLMKDEIQ